MLAKHIGKVASSSFLLRAYLYDLPWGRVCTMAVLACKAEPEGSTWPVVDDATHLTHQSP